MFKPLRQSLLILLTLSLLTGVLYPLLITGMAQVIFPRQANGSLIYRDGKAVGSSLIGQNFDDPKYFWGRPSATTPMPYNAASSGASNLGPTNPALADAVRARIAALKAAGTGSFFGQQTQSSNKTPAENMNLSPSSSAIPVDLVTTSGSGLDPHISPAAAEYQLARVARVRGLSEQSVRQLVLQHTEKRTLGLLGEPRVNVVELNLDLDHLER
jgi:potassium-transporting ATPase KdpC subunit